MSVILVEILMVNAIMILANVRRVIGMDLF